ncbi:MAG: uridine kinase [Bacteroidetes bacterium]|nr:uridine kinase [Bacteroidota bacterium]
MLGDVLLIEDKHRNAGQKIVDFILKNRKGKMMVGISGESGSGKSELAHVIARLLRKEGIMAKPIHIDNYYRILPLERTEWRKNHGIENVVGYGEYDWDKIYQNIRDFKDGKTSSMPCVDLVTEQVDTLITDFKGIDMLIIDGLYAIKTEGIDIRIFIELTYHETKKAQLVRGKEPQNEYRMRVLEQEHKMVQALRPVADLLITKEYEMVSAGKI